MIDWWLKRLPERKTAQKLNVFHQRCLHKILHVTNRDHLTSEEVLLRTKPSTLECCNVVESRWWQAKKRTFKENTAQNIPGSHQRTSHKDGLNTLRWIVPSSVKLLPNVPTGTAGTKTERNCESVGIRFPNVCEN